jgi:hypothetical protein
MKNLSKTVVLFGAFLSLSAQAQSSSATDSCVRYVKSNPTADWTLDACVEEVPLQACHKTKNNEQAIFGNTSRALFVELVTIYKNSCSVAPQTLTDEEMKNSENR